MIPLIISIAVLAGLVVAVKKVVVPLIVRWALLRMQTPRHNPPTR